MAKIVATKDFFLWSMSAIYLFAFASLYIQIPGLYGANGILPAESQLKRNGRHPVACFQEKPTLLWFAPDLGLSTEHAMELFCVLGCLLSVVCLVSRRMRDSISYGCLWFLYLSVYQVGQTFLWFQWDILLLETGILTILVAPLHLYKGRDPTPHHHDAITLWLVRWLLFRLMFASGVVKLTSRCPTWWGLTALNYHYESQCIATPLAWYAHQLPEWLQKLSVVATYFIEIALPFLFFAPFRRLKLFAFYGQMLLQELIILTGNYNFFNLLTMALCISLLDDRYLGKDKNVYHGTSFSRFLRSAICVSVYAGLFYGLIHYFELKIDFDSFSVTSNLAFSEYDFFNALTNVMPYTVWMGIISLGAVIITALWRSATLSSGVFNKCWSVFLCCVFAIIAVFMFTISLVPHSVVDRQAYDSLSPTVHKWKSNLDHLQVVNSFGLFRRMTGVGGRPEVIVEGSNNIERGWKAYEFLYKPGNVSEAPVWVAPHQPRLDWQMWFAALGSYRHNPWFLNMVYRLLTDQPEVLALIKDSPFPDKPPKYIRATLFHYHYTQYGTEEIDWWKRDEVNEYLPPVSLKNQQFMDIIQKNGIKLKKTTKKSKSSHQPNLLEQFVVYLRSLIGHLSGTVLILSLFLPCLFYSLYYS
ncbi:lipase maturation factor 2-like [Lytechinus pictus]|uniref:lipase maturation factor 2-like n=1 Tax=Lytechinus pictus TaxID=7653 RepID=UPI0030B9C9E1